MSNSYSAVYDRLHRRLPVINESDDEYADIIHRKRRYRLSLAAQRVVEMKEAPRTDKLSKRVPKSFWIPSVSRYVPASAIVAVYRYCKGNPGTELKHTIGGDYGTTDDVLREIRAGIHDRIYLRQFIQH